MDLQKLAQLEEGAVCFPDGTDNRVIAVKYDGQVYAYRNACPHLGIPLNSTHDRVIAKSGQYLMCSGHGAIFETRTGACVAGPCNGAQLEPVTLSEPAN